MLFLKKMSGSIEEKTVSLHALALLEEGGGGGGHSALYRGGEDLKRNYSKYKFKG